MSDLADFLLQRIAEDEAAAQTALDDATVTELTPNGEEVEWVPRVTWGPIARVLAECAAKRRIVEDHPRDDTLDYCATCFSGDFNSLGEREFEEFPCPALRALVSVYAGHPEFREEWR